MITEWSYVGKALQKLWTGFVGALKDDTSDPLAFTYRCFYREMENNLIFADQVPTIYKVSNGNETASI
jgi:hypothetical protein